MNKAQKVKILYPLSHWGKEVGKIGEIIDEYTLPSNIFRYSLPPIKSLFFAEIKVNVENKDYYYCCSIDCLKYV